MKLYLTTSNIISIILLNPHGSDETVDTNDNKIVEINFLTHTVQMKRTAMKVWNPKHKHLLNPHGSDETSFQVEKVELPYQLLNPHGSDET